MNLAISNNTNLGDAMQAWCMSVLEMVAKKFKGASVEPNGFASAKLLIPADIGYDYVYLGFEPNGVLGAAYQQSLSGGEPSVLVGPFKLERAVQIAVSSMAQKILAQLRD